MSRTAHPYNQCLDVLKRLHQTQPSFSMGRHLSTALADYGDTWGLSDKELLYALEKYEAELDFIAPESEIDRIVKEGMNLDTILLDDEDEDDF